MAAFTSLTETLPDPAFDIAYDGSALNNNAGRTFGPGFASVKFSSDQPMLRDRTNSGRLLVRSVITQRWKINITYNPMTRVEFEPVYNFLLRKRGGIEPFFVVLPQYTSAQDTTFAASAYHSALSVDGSSSVAAGTKTLLISNSNYNYSTHGTPRPGDLFRVSDSNNSNHQKAYMVTRVETNADYQNGLARPSVSQLRLSFEPGFSKAVSSSSTFDFDKPKIKVATLADVQEYTLNTDNLYQYSLALEEVL